MHPSVSNSLILRFVSESAYQVFAVAAKYEAEGIAAI